MANNYSIDKTPGTGVEQVNVKFRSSDYTPIDNTKNTRKSVQTRPSGFGASVQSSLKDGDSPARM